MMTRNKIIIIALVASVILPILLVLVFHKKTPTIIKPSSSQVIKAAIDSAIAPLKRENDSLLRENDSLHHLYIEIQKRNTELKAQIIESRNSIGIIQKYYNEKISSVDRFTPANIDSFVSNRYLHR